jgi:DNA-binding transcriptional regulator YdaS (Cro superfamily)
MKSDHAEILKKYLIDSGTTQRQLARQVGVTDNFVNHWVHGRRPIPIVRAKKVEEATKGAIRREQLYPDIFAS